MISVQFKDIDFYKLIYKFNTISIKIPAEFLEELDKVLLRLNGTIQAHKQLRLFQKGSTNKELDLKDIKKYCVLIKTIIIETICNWGKNK